MYSGTNVGLKRKLAVGVEKNSRDCVAILRDIAKYGVNLHLYDANLMLDHLKS